MPRQVIRFFTPASSAPARAAEAERKRAEVAAATAVGSAALFTSPQEPTAVLAGPVSGDPAAPGYRTLVTTDVLHTADNGLAAPQPIRAVINDFDYRQISSVYDHTKTPTENTAAIQELVDWCCLNGKKLWVDRGAGYPYLVCPGTPSWPEAGPQSAPARRALTINHDAFHLVGMGGRMVMVEAPGTPPVNVRNYMFSTLQNLSVGDIATQARGAVDGVTIEGNPVDWDENISYASGLTSNSMMALAGVSRIRIRSALFTNSAQEQHGAVFAIFNSLDGDWQNVEHTYLQQHINFMYSSKFSFDRILLRRFNEFVDVNMPCYGFKFHNIDADNLGSTGSESQIVDYVGQDLFVSKVRARNLRGNVLAAYAKGKGWEDYPTAVAKNTELIGQLNPSPIPLLNITFEDVYAYNCGFAAGDPMIFVGSERNPGTVEEPAYESVGGVGNGEHGTLVGVTYAPIPVLRNVNVRHIRCEASCGVAIREGYGVTVDDVIVRSSPNQGPRSEYYDLRVGQQVGGGGVTAASGFSGSITNCASYDSRHGGILLQTPGTCVARDLYVVGWGRAPIVGQAPPRAIRANNVALGQLKRSGWVVNDTRASSSIGSNVPAVQISGFGDGAGGAAPGVEVFHGGGDRIVGAAYPMVCGSGADIARQANPRQRIRLRSLDMRNPYSPDATQGADSLTREFPILTQAPDKDAWFSYMALVFGAPVTIDTGATTRFEVRKRKADGSTVRLGLFATITDATVLAQGSSIGLPLTPSVTTADLWVKSGEQVYLVGLRDTTGGAGGIGIYFPDATVEISMPDWLNT